ncbi:PREDICTED: isoamyl acetate-hydrolyzing esterase 1 homolog [Dipodomys ordii]|uniref:1-alkyl-2-acetylglycerophosphocholine esterase n=1 Tax=Dipodomys ordii TaxID=10020 RepID=A0A1S3EX82_DIPOR|nr:PREDICTED: isoamyl acetate-hydrolyzing esterase 1 homolog [Dipodomys ordii]
MRRARRRALLAGGQIPEDQRAAGRGRRGVTPFPSHASDVEPLVLFPTFHAGSALVDPRQVSTLSPTGYKLNRLNSAVGEYARACLQVARDCGTEVLDLWTLMQKDNQDFSAYLSDGLHLSPKGNEFLFLHLWPLIEKRVSHLPLLLPYWKEVSETEPELSLLGGGDHA